MSFTKQNKWINAGYDLNKVSQDRIQVTWQEKLIHMLVFRIQFINLVQLLKMKTEGFYPKIV
jgi:hypothetical protein